MTRVHCPCCPAGLKPPSMPRPSPSAHLRESCSRRTRPLALGCVRAHMACPLQELFDKHARAYLELNPPSLYTSATTVRAAVSLLGK